MSDAPVVCFRDAAHDAFMAEFFGDERSFVLSWLASWPEVEIDWLIPDRARIIGMRYGTREDVLITQVIRF
jgi:hypothetical protein